MQFGTGLMMILIVLAWLVALPLSLILLYLAIELALGLAKLRDTSPAFGATGVDMAIIVPAHDEESGIADTVNALRQAAPAAVILVVADNCRDRTAILAREAGAEVAERHDPERRGKGYALAFGRDWLAASPPDTVLVIDADCRLATGSAERLAARAVTTGRPVQAANLLVADPVASPLIAISNFAMLIKNLVRARGLTRIGGGALLFGTGMAFPWALFERLPLATADAVEDLQMGLWLARQGISVTLDDGAKVTSPAASVADSKGQRSRWEHGFLRVAGSQALPLLLAGAKQGSRNLAALGAHMLVPPLALLMLVALAGLGLLTLLCLLMAHWLPLMLATGSFIIAVMLLLAAWWQEGRAVLPLPALLRAPLYVLWKLPIYLGFFTRRQTGWNRTRREGDQP